MKIGELAGRSGLNGSAIRYYERRGLLPAPDRAGGQLAGTPRTHSAACSSSALRARWDSR
jgi:hypothetical protein